MKTLWLSTNKMTISVDVDDDQTIIDGSPIIRVFIGQKLKNLIKWMEKQGGLRFEEIK